MKNIVTIFRKQLKETMRNKEADPVSDVPGPGCIHDQIHTDRGDAS